jgi:hypothetical protein
MNARRHSTAGQQHVTAGRGATEQGDEADEARLEGERGMTGGCRRGRAAIVWVLACLRASQPIASVRWTSVGWEERVESDR